MFKLFLQVVLVLALASNTAARKASLGKVSSLSKPSHSRSVHVEETEKKDLERIIATGDKSIPWQGISCIVGGALAHLTLGTVYCWGNFLSYSPPKMRFLDGLTKLGTQPDALYVIPLTLISQALAMPVGPILTTAVGPRWATLFGSWCTAAAVILGSYQEKLSTFMMFYSVLFGFGVGLAYTAPMTAGWKWMPNSKGLVTGGILTGFGAGGFFFSLLGSKFVNPGNLNAVNGVFPDEVYAAFPGMLRKLGLIYAVVSLIGSLMVIQYPSDPMPIGSSTASGGTAVQSSQQDGLSLGEAVKTSQFWLIWAMIISSGTAGLNTAAVYKQFAAGEAALTGDSFQALVGGIGALFNGFGRLFWGSFLDVVGFRKAFTLLTLLQMTSCLTYSFSTVSRFAFAANTCLLFFCLAGNLALMPPATQRIFGPKAGASIYGVLFSAFGIASVAGGMLTKALSKSLGWSGLFQVLALMSLLATAMVSMLQPIQALPSSSV